MKREKALANYSSAARLAAMLVLSRKEGERIQIGDDVVVTVVRTSNNVVRLGIEAPPHITIVRSELAIPTDDANQSAAPAENPAT